MFSPRQVAAKIHSLLPRAHRAKLDGHKIQIPGGVGVAVADSGVNVRSDGAWWRALPGGLSCREIADHVSYLALQR